MKLPKLSALAIILSLYTYSAQAQRGKEGDVTISGNVTVNTFTYLTADAGAGSTSIQVNNNTMSGGAFASNLAAGDLIMIMQMQGASMDINTTPTVVWGGNYTVPDDYITGTFGANPHFWGRITNFGQAGIYERVEVLSVSGSGTINLNCALTKNFVANGHVQVVRIPRYNNLTVPGGNSITTTNWNGNNGGVVALEVNGNLSLNGTISATGSGFRGGALDPNSYTAAGAPTEIRVLGSFDNLEGSEKGEGIGGFYTEYDALFSRYGIGAPANGGGGGGYQNAGGGGGSNVVVGGSYTGKGNPQGYTAVWDLESAGFGGSTSAGGGRGGYAISDVDQNELVVGPANAAWGGDDRKVTGGFGGHELPFVADRLFAGGGGGAGDQDSGEGGAGGRGGGIVVIQVYGTTTGSGTIEARGLAGQNTNPNNVSPSSGTPRRGVDGAGGGGAGGSVSIENISAIPSSITINVSGGDGGNQNITLLNVSPLPPLSTEAGGPGGSGAGGLIRVGSGAPTKIAAAGAQGVTNSSHMVNFPPNGATAGSDGFCCYPNNPTYNILTSDQSICSGASITLTATRPSVGSPVPSTASFVWYDAMVGGTQVGTGSSFTTPALTATTTYWVGICPGTFRTPVTVTILPPDDATFSYAGSPYCSNGTDPTPTVTGLAGGTFSSTAGLSINSSTGTIDLSASTPGTYTVTYTTSGPCPNSSTQSITINALDDATFSYASASYCVGEPDPTPTITGVAGGTFSSTAGLSINASSGVIDLSASTPGSYTITYTTSGSCSNSSTFAMTITTLEDASFSYSAASYCVANTDPTPTVTGVAGGTFSSTAGLSIDASTGTIDLSASTPGTYTVTYTTSGACSNSSTQSVTITSLDDASFNYSAAAYCANDTDPIPTITGVAGGAFSSTAGLSINASTGAIDVSTSTPGTYTVTYTTSGACANSSNVSVTINALDDASFSYSAAAYCANDTDPTPTVTGLAGGTFSSTAGLSINASTGVVDLSASTPGTYTITYTTSGTCSNSSNVSMTVNALDDASFSYSSPSYCLAQADPTPTVTGLGGGSFSSSAGLVINASTGTIDVSASTPGSYVVTYATAGPCPNSATFNVSITALDDASFNYSAAAYCLDAADPTPTITGVSGGAFSSTAGLVINTSTGAIDVSASTPGTYTVTYATSGSCANSTNVSVTINALDDASFSYSAAAYCATDTDPTPTVTGLAGGTFSSAAGLSIDASTGVVDLSASTLGTYTVTYTTSGTCPNSSNVSLTVNATDDASFSYGAASYCSNDTDPTPTVTGLAGGSFSSTAGLSINASTGVIDLSASTTGSYVVTYTTSGSCPNSSTVNVTVNAMDDASFAYGAASYCADATDPTPTVTGLAGGTFSSTAGLSINASTGVIDVSASTPGAYVVTYTTSGSCPNTSTVNVTINALDDATFSYGAASYCTNATDPTPTVSGLAGGTFSSTAGLSLDASTGAIDVSASTAGTYTITYTTSGACPNSSTATVTINTMDDASFSYASTSYCVSGTDPSPTVTGLSGGTFTSTAGLVIDATTGQIDVSASTIGSYTVTYTTAGACPNTATAPITILSADDAAFTMTATCDGGTASVPGTTGGVFSLVGTPAGVTIDPATGTVTGGTSGATYTVQYATSGACAASSTASVTVLTSPVIDPIADITACDQANLPTITGTGFSGDEAFYNDLQSNGGVQITGPVTSSQTVYVYATNSGCSDEISFNVTINTTDDPTFSLTNFCEGAANSASISGTTGGTFDFNPAVTDGATIDATTGEISNGVAGTIYSVEYTTTGACPASAVETVEAYAIPVAPTVSSDQTYCSGDVLAPMTASTPSGTLTWYDDFGLTNVIGTGSSQSPYSFDGTTTYYVTATNNGCESPESTIAITIEDCDIIVPTAFTPDNDGANDDWELVNIDVIYPNNIVRVYNRWGNLVFESPEGDYDNNRWNGTFNGEMLPVGSYYYIIEPNQEGVESKSGSVSIILGN